MIYDSLNRTYNYLLRANAVNQYSLITEPNGTTYAQVHDADGNLTGSYTTQYTYDAFGRTISSNGTEADNFTYRFSTKPMYGSDLYYYGYRYYDPQHGRWISRDPLEEEGGVNLYGMARNNLMMNWDFWGLANGNGERISTPWPSPVPGLPLEPWQAVPMLYSKFNLKEKPYDPQKQCCNNEIEGDKYMDDAGVVCCKSEMRMVVLRIDPQSSLFDYGHAFVETPRLCSHYGINSHSKQNESSEYDIELVVTREYFSKPL